MSYRNAEFFPTRASMDESSSALGADHPEDAERPHLARSDHSARFIFNPPRPWLFGSQARADKHALNVGLLGNTDQVQKPAKGEFEHHRQGVEYEGNSRSKM